LEDIYDAEQQLTDALPKLEQKAGSGALKQIIGKHLEQTKGQVAALERVFEDMDRIQNGGLAMEFEPLLTRATLLPKSLPTVKT